MTEHRADIALGPPLTQLCHARLGIVAAQTDAAEAIGQLLANCPRSRAVFGRLLRSTRPNSFAAQTNKGMLSQAVAEDGLLASIIDGRIPSLARSCRSPCRRISRDQG